MAHREVLILSGDSYGNLGDRAIAASLCAEIRSVDPHIAVYLPSRFDQSRTLKGVNASLLPRGIRGALLTAWRASRASLVLCGGGGLFQDDDSLVKMPYWALRLLALRPFSRKMVGVSIGAGPLESLIGRLSARVATAVLDSISVRDCNAKRTLQPLVCKPVSLVADPAFMLEPSSVAAADTVLERAGVPNDGRPLIGVALRRCFHANSDLIPHQLKSRLPFYEPPGTARMAALNKEVVTALLELEQRFDAHIIFMPTYNAPYEDDFEACDQVASSIPSGSYTLLRVDDPAVYKRITERLSVMLAGRMHAAIMAMGMGTPAVGLAYNPKFRGMFGFFGNSQACFDVDAMVDRKQGPDLAGALVRALRCDDRNRPLIRERAGELAEQTRSYLRELFEQTDPLSRRSSGRA